MMTESGHEPLLHRSASAGAHSGRRPLAAPGRLLQLALIGGLLGLAPAALEGVTTSAQAQESAWDEGHASRARLIAGGGDGHSLLAGIEIELADGYKTYWRHAGDSGLPPEIDWEGSQNVADIALDFPVPGRFSDSSGTFFGYQDAVILPLTITPVDPTQPVTLVADLSYGVCMDVCIPAFGDFELTIPAAQSGSHAPRIARALTQVPRKVEFGETVAGLAFDHYAISDGGDLVVAVAAPANAMLLAEGPDYNWFLDPAAQARVDTQTGLQSFKVEIVETPRALDDATEFRLTLIAAGAAVETRIVLDGETIRRLAER